MGPVWRFPQFILVKCLLLLLLVSGGCGWLPASIQPVGQAGDNPILAPNNSAPPSQAGRPATATSLPDTLPERPLYVVDSSFTGQERLSSIFLIDADERRIVWSQTTRYHPEVALSPDGERLFVADSYWTQVTRGEQRDVLSVYDAHHGTLLEDDVPIQGRLLYKAFPSASQPYMFLSLDGRLLFVEKYGNPDIHQFLRLDAFAADTRRLLFEGNWPDCERPSAEQYSRQACAALSAQDPLKQFPGAQIRVPAGWIASRDRALSPDGKRLYLGYDTRFPEQDVFTDTILVYDTASWQRLATIPLEAPVTHFALSASGDRLYAVSPFSRSLVIYATDNFQTPSVMSSLGISPALILVPGTQP